MAEYDLTGRNVIMTGAGRGLGLAMTEALTEAGANVLAAAHIACGKDALHRRGGPVGRREGQRPVLTAGQRGDTARRGESEASARAPGPARE